MMISILFLPLAGFFISLVLSYYLYRQPNYSKSLSFISWFLNCAFLAYALVLSGIVLLNIMTSEFPILIQGPVWFISGNFIVNFSIYFDILAASMVMLVLFVSLLVHFYSYFYINKSDNLPRFLSYLSLFTFSMILLLISDNLLQMFIGWEAISLCSYLLIVYWYKKDITNQAAKKAFLINRFADMGFLLGVFAIFVTFNTLSLVEINNSLELGLSYYFSFLGREISLLTAISFCFILAAFAKSAQIFLHLWLPDAMEAPTPVSALLHAATMVTAGIFLMVKLSQLLQYSTTALDTIMLVSSITMIYAAIVACTQRDIKKIIAYSTISQLSYMFLAISLSFDNGAIFHLFTHAFFKALLFLGAGSVIHSLSGEQNIYNMGGLWKKTPVTYLTMLVGSAALIGIPGLSGYYSKEAIIHIASSSISKYAIFAYYSSLLGVFLTTFYSLRLIVLVFHGEYKGNPEVKPHESSFGMLSVLIILSLFAIFFGKITVETFIGADSFLFWKESIITDLVDFSDEGALTIMLISLANILLAVLLIYVFYIKRKSKLSLRFPIITKIIYNNFYLDAIYNNLIVKFFNSLGRRFSYFDNKILDHYGPNTIAGLIYRVSKYLSKIQTGYISLYATVMLIGVVILIGYCMIIFKIY